ncbi:methyltransferase [Kocuria rhizophila]|nr:methyltransferase [Kocuria rhizophila]
MGATMWSHGHRTPVPHYFVSDPSLPEKRRVWRGAARSARGRGDRRRRVLPGDLDKGTAALLRTVPDPQHSLLDIGCGWGPITIALAQAAPEARVTAVDVNQRSLQLTARTPGPSA